jgi:hypothetical protein
MAKPMQDKIMIKAIPVLNESKCSTVINAIATRIVMITNAFKTLLNPEFV